MESFLLSNTVLVKGISGTYPHGEVMLVEYSFDQSIFFFVGESITPYRTSLEVLIFVTLKGI